MAPVPESTDAAAPPAGASDFGRPPLDGAVQPLAIPRFVDDRGSLTPLQLAELGFAVARTFVVTAPAGAVRGGHAHRSVRQVFFRASGRIDVEFRHRGASARLTLDEEHPAVLVDAGVWAQQTYLVDGSTLIVFADGGYDPSEYLEHDRGVDGAAP